MAKSDFTPFSATLNPFRALDRQIDRMFDEGFGAASGGALSRTGGAMQTDTVLSMPPPSLFMRVVGITTRHKP